MQSMTTEILSLRTTNSSLKSQWTKLSPMKKKKSFLRPTNQVFTTSKMFSKMKRSVKSKNSTELCKIDSLAVIDLKITNTRMTLR